MAREEAEAKRQSLDEGLESIRNLLKFRVSNEEIEAESLRTHPKRLDDFPLHCTNFHHFCCIIKANGDKVKQADDYDVTVREMAFEVKARVRQSSS